MYDQHQVVDAVLRQCGQCRRWFYFTNPKRYVCLMCREQQRDEHRDDVLPRA